MFVLKQFLATVALYLIAVSMITTAAADEGETTSLSPLNSRTSAEGINLQLVASDNGSIVAIRIQECESCQPTTLLPSPEIEIVVGGETVEAEAALSLRGRGGAVLYNSQSRLAEVVIFYGQ